MKHGQPRQDGSTRVGRAVQQGRRISLEHPSDRRSPGRSLATAVANAGRLLSIRREPNIAFATLVQPEQSGPVDDATRTESQVQQGRKAADMSPADRNQGLSLPARAWLIVGAAAALWAIAALVFMLLF